MTITNRDTFLTSVAGRLGRTPLTEKPSMQWQHLPHRGRKKEGKTDAQTGLQALGA